MPRKAPKSWTKAERGNLLRVAAQNNLSVNAVAQTIGVSRDKLAGGLLPLYRDALDRIQQLESRAVAAAENLERTGPEGKPTQQERTTVAAAEALEATEPERKPTQQEPTGVTLAESETIESAEGQQPPIPAQEPAGDTSHPDAPNTETEEEGTMNDNSAMPEGRVENRLYEQGKELGTLNSDVKRALEELKELETARKEYDNALTESKNTQEAIANLNTTLEEVQAALGSSKEERKALAQQLQANAAQLEEQNGKLVEGQTVKLDPKQVEEAMIRCAKEGGEFCELLSADFQRRAIEGGQIKGDHDHVGAEQYWDCPECSKSLMGALGTERFKEIRQAMVRVSPDVDIPVMLERVQEAGMRVVKEENSIFLPNTVPQEA